MTLANKIFGMDFSSRWPDFNVTFNGKAGIVWYYGTDGNTPPGQYDFVTVALHEIGHGLGFSSRASDNYNFDTGEVEGGQLRGGTPSYPAIYDNFVVNGDGTAITSFDDPSDDLLTQFTSGNLFWDGTQGKAANNGNRPKISALHRWTSANYIHLDENTYPAGNINSLMTPTINYAESTHHPGPITLGMLEDMGWTINTPPVLATDTATYSVAENTATGVNIGSTLSATDKDSSDTLRYSLRGIDAASFSIESTTGQLKTFAALNYETKNTYTLTVAVDDGVAEDTMAVTINVTDVNDAPVFSTDGIIHEIMEDTPANQNIGMPVSATDEDDATVTYSLGGTDAASFSIDNRTGQLKTKSTLNYDTKSTYEITVVATDSRNLSSSISVTINVLKIVNFTDTALAAAVRSALGIAANASILTNALETLTSLTAIGNGITDVTELKYATGLTSLNLSDNAIVNLSSLEDLVNLETLNLADNEIVNLSPLRNLTNLESLDLDDNKIENISVLSDLSRLARLELRNNDVMDVTPLSEMTHLTHLYLSGNDNLMNIKRLLKLTSTTVDIDLPDPVDIPDVNLAAALRSALGLPINDPILPEEMEQLTNLTAPGRDIADLTGLETALDLTDLTLSNNNIDDLEPLEDLTSLENLNLSDNAIVDLESLEELTSLETLDLRNNQITDVSPLAALTNLTRLELGGNSVTNPGALYKLKQGGTTIIGVDVPDAVVFADANLEKAVKQALQIAAVDLIAPDVLATLTSLTASRKQITSLSGLEAAGLLERLDIGQNDISDLAPLSDLTNLEVLDLADNDITNISALSSLTKLEQLDLRNNDITDTALLSTMTHLRYLYVSGNDNLSNLKQLVKLKNAGTSIDITLPRPVNITDDNLEDELQIALGFPTNEPIFPEDLESLTTFTASNRSITTLTGLEKATNLTSLNLSNNTISSISPLSRLTSLTELDLPVIRFQVSAHFQD